MITSLITFLSLVVVIGIWHAVLAAFSGEPTWVRTVMRVVIAGTTLIQAVAFTAVTAMTNDVPMDQLPVILHRVATWTQVCDGTSMVLLGVGAVLLVVFTARRGLKGPIVASE